LLKISTCKLKIWFEFKLLTKNLW